jgi:hypothetical protein
MSINSGVKTCRDALIVSMRAAERAVDRRSIAMVSACLDVVEYLAHQPAATVDAVDTALNVLQRADAEFESQPPRTQAIKTAFHKAVERLKDVREETLTVQPSPSIL